MANIVYADPFGAALQGKEQALRDVYNIGKMGREFRNEDANYDFMKWYEPYRRAEMMNEVNNKLLQSAAQHAHYTGNLQPYNDILSSIGYAPASLPPGYGDGTKVTSEQQRSADIASGAIPTALGYKDVFGAGGVQREAPFMYGQQTQVDPEMQSLERQLMMGRGQLEQAEIQNRMQQLNNPQTSTNFLSPYRPDASFKQQNQTQSNLNPVAQYGINQTQSHGGVPQYRMINSPWEGEYDSTKAISGTQEPSPYRSDQ
jgi:hypothetical protein